MQRLRMSRKGRKHRPFYEIVAVDSRKAPHGEPNASLGHYDPFTKAVHLDMEAIESQLRNGAQPTPMVTTLIKRVQRDRATAAGEVASA